MAKGKMYVDGICVPFDGEKNVLAVIRKAGIDMPTFCYYSELSTFGACRMCVVENEQTGKIDASCSMEPRDGLRIRTNTERLLKHRRMILSLMLSSHCRSCTTCEKSGNCRLQELALRFGVTNIPFEDTRPHYALDETSPAIIRDPGKCVLCGDCVRVCDELQGMSILNFAHRGSNVQVMPAFDRPMSMTKCVTCGQCAAVCPTGAISFVEREAAAYDEAAVQANMQAKSQPHTGCPGSMARSMERAPVNQPASFIPMPSQLRQWPVQIKLVPVNAPYFDGANLLIAADCTAYAYANFHQDFIRGKVTLVGCPKLDDVDYSEKLTEILRQNNIKSVTVVRMEVPCCGGLEYAVRTALQNCGKLLPWQVKTISIKGELLDD